MHAKVFIMVCLVLMGDSVKAQFSKDSIIRFNKVDNFKFTGFNQNKNVFIHLDDKPISLFIFLSPECPLCQNYTKVINQLQQQFKEELAVYGIVVGKAYTLKDVAAFKNKYGTTFNIFIDTKQLLTHYLNATVTPQAILLDSNGNMLYTGAIDNWMQGQGKKRIMVTQHYVKNAIEQSLQPLPITIKKTTAYGCKINDF